MTFTSTVLHCTKVLNCGRRLLSEGESEHGRCIQKKIEWMTVTNLKERNTVSKFQEGVQKSFINTGTAPDTSVTSDSVVFTEYVIHQTCGSVPFIPPGSKCTNETENNNAELLSSNTENIIELFSDANIDDALDFF